MAATIESLLHRPDVWRGGDRHATTPTLASGHRELDAVLPGGGWPLQALPEICHARPGLGELSLMLPAFARAMDDSRWLLFVSAPHQPYAPPAPESHTPPPYPSAPRSRYTPQSPPPSAP